MGTLWAHIHVARKTVKLWWSCEEQSYGKTQQWEGSLSISEGYWHRRYKGMFQFPDWFIPFVCPFEGGTW